MANAEESTKAGLSRLQDDARPTICSDSLELISNIAEVGLDEILQNEFLKDIPVISSLVSIYKIGNNIHNAHLLKKYACFLDEFNRDSFENGSWNKYKQYFEESNRKRDIEYLLILLERYIEEDKARRLAKIYEAYLDKEIPDIALNFSSNARSSASAFSPLQSKSVKRFTLVFRSIRLPN